jgi:transposase-like protein
VKLAPAPASETAATNNDKMVVQLTTAELRALIRAEVERGLRENSPPPPSRWIDVSAAAKQFGCTTQTIRNWIALGAPARQIGASAHPVYRIELAEFEAWVRDQKGKR